VPIVTAREDEIRRLELLRRSEPEDGSGPGEWETARWGTGVEPPADLPPGVGPRTVVRTFAFLDLCGSTAYLDEHGPLQTVRSVTEVRNRIRAVTARRGVRVAKWLGDGAMVVGVQTGPTLATAVELCAAFSGSQLPLRAGVSVSAALLFDGDDYLGRGANFAARLCNAAEPGEVLSDTDCLVARPEWVAVTATREVTVRGMGTFQVAVLGMSAGA
jgi:class 3 adenylate cyclase